MIFAIAGVPFEDKRFELEAHFKCPEWDLVKHDRNFSPFQQLPVLFIDDGEPIAQSQVIGRHLARKFGLLGKTELEQLRIESLNDYLTDIDHSFYAATGHGMPKEEDLRKWQTETLPGMLAKLEAFTKAHGAGWVIGDSISYADARLHCIFSHWQLELSHATFDAAPTIRDLIKKFEQYPAIAAWIQKRPKTAF